MQWKLVLGILLQLNQQKPFLFLLFSLLLSFHGPTKPFLIESISKKKLLLVTLGYETKGSSNTFKWGIQYPKRCHKYSNPNPMRTRNQRNFGWTATNYTAYGFNCLIIPKGIHLTENTGYQTMKFRCGLSYKNLIHA